LENKLESLEKNFQGLEHNIGEKFDFLLEFLQKDKNQKLVVKPHREEIFHKTF
jgi:hypothetical protein